MTLAKEGSRARRRADHLAIIYREAGKTAAEAELAGMIADGMTTAEYVVITDTVRQLVKGA